MLVEHGTDQGGFSIGDVSCQFVPHTANAAEGSLLNITKDVSKLKNQKAGSVKSKVALASKDQIKNSSKSISKKISKSTKGVKL